MQRQDDRGVSPVIGVILMVAITVILAATAASFFIGIGDENLDEGMPTVAMDHTFQVDNDGGHLLRISHTGGESVARDRIRVVVSGADCSRGRDPNNRYTPGGLGADRSEITAGSMMKLSSRTLCRDATARLNLRGSEVTVSWISQGGSSSNRLWRWRGPAG